MLAVIRSVAPGLRAVRHGARALSSAQPADASWTEQFTAATEELRSDVTFEESAARLRKLTQTNLLHATDISNNPQRFFEAHRILARHAVQHGPGFWIRFTVHYNLFAGTVIAVGNENQVAGLSAMQEAGELGCFSLTEKLAGVQSGLVVQTTATYDPNTKGFVINTPNVGARKNWISQGFTADKTVVLADLIMDGKSRGPHAFLMDFRRGGELVPGIEIDDMGAKTVGNDLDNAWIHFHNVAVPGEALLSRYVEIDDSGAYVTKQDGVRPFDMIGQRLYTGRVAVAQAALEYRRELFRRTREYSDSKECFSFQGKPVLSSIPQLRALYEENDAEMERLDRFVSQCEDALSATLKDGGIPSSGLVDAIATAKVQAVERSIAMCFRLKQEVGSYALMSDAGFRHMDFLQCAKFAEGDSRILMQKMARDRLKQFMGAAQAGREDTGSAEEKELCMSIVSGMEKFVKAGHGDKTAAWDSEWKNVYALADAVMGRVMAKGI